MAKTVEEINEKIRSGKVVVLTAEQMIAVVADKGPEGAAREVDVVTTGTFAPMCSSGAFLNTGHTHPKCKFHHVWLNGVPAYGALAAVDLYIGATALREGDPANSVYPGGFLYGGGHVIEDLAAGRDVELYAKGYGTDGYPRKEVRTLINIGDLNQAILTNPRNCYQNYNVAVNAHANRVIYTYMGVLQPRMANANYCSAGQLSPLLNDPHYRTTGVGTRIFLGGGVGYVWSEGTQHDPTVERNAKGVPTSGAGSLAVTGDMKRMSSRWLRGASVTGYGVSLAVGIGVPIPVLDAEMARFTAVRDEDITAPVVDYSSDYGNNKGRPLAHVTYAELKSGAIELNGKRVLTAGLSSYARALEIAETLKAWISQGRFELTTPVAPIADHESGVKLRPLRERTPE